MKIENMVLVIMACFLIFISMSCICACDDLDVANTRDVDSIIVDDAMDDSINVVDDGGSSAADNVIVDGGSSAADNVIVDGGSSAADNVVDDGGSSAVDNVVVDGGSIIRNMTKNVPKYNNGPISNVQVGGNSFKDVQNLIDALPAGSVLYLYDDFTMQKGESPILISKDLTIDGSKHKLDANKKGTIFEIIGGNVVLSNLTLINAKAPVNGGGIYVHSAKSLEFKRIDFKDDVADDYGGGVYIDSSIPSTFIDCYFVNNYADDHDGGAIFTRGELTCIDCDFRYNKAEIYGGAIRSESSVNCTHCYFQKNYCENQKIVSTYGAAISSSSLVNCRDCDFVNNSASFGSAIHSLKNVYVENSDFRYNTGNGAINAAGNIVADSSNFTSNEALNTGATISSESTVNCTNCCFTNNVAAAYGIILAKTVIAVNSIFRDNFAEYASAIYASGECTVKNCEFTRNYGKYDYKSIYKNYGGAIYSCGLLTACSCKFSYNVADDRGGAIYVENGLKLVGDNEFVANVAHDFGGAIYSKGDVYVNWEDNGKTTFKSNNAISDNGGAIYSEKSVYVRNGVFDSNFAEDNGGAIFSKGDTYVNWNGDGDTIFKYNLANTDEGGSIYSEGNVYVKNSDFSYGYAHNGGAIFVEGNAIIDSSVFNVNHATHQGGAIYDQKGLSLRGRTSFAANEAGDSGGAIYTRKFDEDVYHATFRYNVAGDDGGAIYIDHENHETFTECDFEDNYAGDEGGAIYLDDGDSSLSLKRNNLVNNKAKSGYTVYNHGNYGELKDNWHGSSSPNFDNQFKKYRLILKDKVITPSSYAKTRISW